VCENKTGASILISVPECKYQIDSASWTRGLYMLAGIPYTRCNTIHTQILHFHIVHC